MGSIKSSIELYDNFSTPMMNFINSINMGVGAAENFQRVISRPVDNTAYVSMQNDIDSAVQAVNELQMSLASLENPSVQVQSSFTNLEQPTIDVPDSIDVPVVPVVAEQPMIDVPDGLTVPISATVTEQPSVDVPDGLTVPVTPYVTEQPVIDVPDVEVPVTPQITEQPVIDIPDVEVPVTPYVTEQPTIDVPDSIDVPVTADTSPLSQYQTQLDSIEGIVRHISNIQEQINSQAENQMISNDELARLAEINGMIDDINARFSAMQNSPFDLGTETAVIQMRELGNAIQDVLADQQALDKMLSGSVQINAPPAQQVPVTWQSDSIETFTSSGIERFQQEVQSTNDMLNTLNQTQSRIAAQAASTNIFPPNMVADMSGMETRLQAIQTQIQRIESNPLNMGTDEANAELERLRGQLDQAVQQQQAMNTAIDSMDMSAANAAYLELSQTVDNTERYIRDNVTEQGQFNSAIQQGTRQANQLQSVIGGVVAAYTGIAGIRKAINWIDECTQALNTQLNTENQLMIVLGNMLDADYVSQFEIEVSADTSEAVDAINAISSSVDSDMTITVSAETQALQAEFDAITAKASEIQSQGIYGDEAMIGAAAEFATYFSDVEAITTMMDTLADYAMGMSGGGAIDTSSMIDYATNLGKIMSGSYDAMTKKGFEFSDAQKAIVEGTATQEQIVSTLGQEYLDMSADMQAAAAISQVIEESWAGLYQSMSDTPEGKIIQMTNAFGDMQEVVGGKLYPFVLLFVDAINNNWPTIEAAVYGITTALQFMMGILSAVLETALNVGSFISDNWSIISPIIYGVAAALGAYLAVLTAYNTVQAVSNGLRAIAAFQESVQAASVAMATGATIAETAAQYGLNAALAACPITWIVIAVVALIAAIYAVCSAIAQMTGVANSGFGVITGGISVVIAFFQNLGLSVANIALGIWSAIGALCTNMMAAFSNAISSIQSWFYDLLSTAMSVIAGIASALNSLPFVEFDYSGITAAADDYAAKSAAAAASNKQEYTSVSDAFSSGAGTFDTFQSGWASKAFSSGASWGDGVVDSISSALDPTNLFSTSDIPTATDYAYSGGNYDLGGIPEGVDDIAGNTGSIAGNTGSIADSMDITQEELKYMRDIAEQEIVNRFTTAEITIHQENQNNISSNMDLDGVMTKLTDQIREAREIAAEGDHD